MSRDKSSSYYDVGGIEVLDVIKAKLTPEQYQGYLLGNSIKYTLRCNYKGSRRRDLEKAANYAKWAGEEQAEHEKQVKEAYEASMMARAMYESEVYGDGA